MPLFDRLQNKFDDWDGEVSLAVQRTAKKTGLPENLVGGALAVGAAAVGAKAGLAAGAGHLLSAAGTLSKGKKAVDLGVKASKKFCD